MSSSRIRRTLFRVVVDAAWWGIGLSGCQLVFGEYHAGPGTAGSAGVAHAGGTTPAGGAAGAAASSGGAEATGGSGSNDCTGNPRYRCQDVLLQECIAGQWTTKHPCTRAALCQPDLGVCDVCATGERTCNGSRLSLCNENHTAFVETANCASPLYCDVGVDYCVACTARQARCNGDDLDVCNSQRTAWDWQSCNGLGCQVVDGTADYCNVCTASDAPVCVSAATLRSCVSGKWKASACQTGCAEATATTPAACY